MATYQSYTAIGQREDLSDVIYNISPTDTPFMSSIGKAKATAVYHEWQTDALASVNVSNAAVEGATASDATISPTTRVGNRTQISQKTVKISGTLDAVNKVIASKIKPSKQIEEYIPNLNDVYGIHLRRTDKIKLKREIEHENSIDEFNCIIYYLINDIIELLKNDNEAKLLIVGEEKEWISEFKTILQSKFEKDINFVNILYPENYINDGFIVVLDMFCLSRCKKIYQGVKWTTFSSLSALIGNVDIVNYYYKLPEQESNFIYTWKSVLNINGKIEYTEYENIGNRLNDIQIKYINTNNILF
jgi:hypothetical protein